MAEGESRPKADEEMVRTDEGEGTREVDQPMEKGEQEGEAKTTEDVNNKQVWPWCKRGRAMKHSTRRRRTRRVWMQRKSYGARHLCND